MSQQLSIKELAAELGRNRSYVQAMKKHGFKMRGGRATLDEALQWLDENPHPCRKGHKLLCS